MMSGQAFPGYLPPPRKAHQRDDLLEDLPSWLEKPLEGVLDDLLLVMGVDA